ncbi:Capsule assembly protein Wzi [Granulicella pectinivorans]|uniref:Capsule assembly protein Wzi n=1 Tax=Granulicella pectinivorans TaxID=474950 RepID=A0A1I6MH42_9BACT|nr:capsule assembly Wzi family protein [Granulicella pectinivorans]SFS14979.1 Capsule assembly protein Wzi [Granulicella pectinivorans]
MRKGFFLTWAGLAVCGFYPALAQTTPAQEPAKTPAPSVAVPSTTPASDLPSLPGYEMQKGKPNDPMPQDPPAKTVPPPQPPPNLTPSVEPTPFSAYVPYGVPDEYLPKGDPDLSDTNGSAYIPLDSWVYPALERLYGMGFIDTMYLSLRPYTRRSVMHMLRYSGESIMQSDNEQAQDILAQLLAELSAEKPANLTDRGLVFGVHQVYDRAMYINGQTLRDSYHLGQTISNDYGRPYEPGFNNIAGASYLAELGRFSFYARAEYQHAPSSANGYQQPLVDTLNYIDQMPTPVPGRANATIPAGTIAAANPFRIVEAALSFHLLSHEFSIGKSDAWLGPAHGAAFAWTNNAENIYSFRINRVEPLRIPLLSRVLGPVRYDFFYGSLKGHTAPNSPYVHSEQFSFSPTVNFQFGFQRTIIFGGAGHSPVTVSKFFKSFFDFADTTAEEKYSRDDPGARFTTFTASYRLPFVRKYATFYVDSMSHDDVTPISAPRRADIRTGLYLSQIPGLRRLDIRAEGVLTDPRVSRSQGGQFAYFETIQKQGYTNKGYIMGDWIGREAKGGQAWFTYHLAPNEYVELQYLRKKNAKDFIYQGTTQDQVKITAVKRFARKYELNAWVQYEKWEAPIYMPGKQSDTTAAVQFSYYPRLHTNDR